MATSFTFGPYRLDTDAAILFHENKPLPLGKRAVALLAALLDRPDTPISKELLIAAAWPAQAIEDSNLTVQIAAIRRTLGTVANGAGWIETLPRRGYRFVGPPVAVGGNGAPRALALPDGPSIAVLPFANLSGNAVQDYFVDGIVDDIITGLSRINWLFVVARASTAIYRGRPVDIRQVSHDLGVRYVLRGKRTQPRRPTSRHLPTHRCVDRRAHLGGSV